MSTRKTAPRPTAGAQKTNSDRQLVQLKTIALEGGTADDYQRAADAYRAAGRSGHAVVLERSARALRGWRNTEGADRKRIVQLQQAVEALRADRAKHWHRESRARSGVASPSLDADVCMVARDMAETGKSRGEVLAVLEDHAPGRLALRCPTCGRGPGDACVDVTAERYSVLDVPHHARVAGAGRIA